MNLLGHHVRINENSGANENSLGSQLAHQRGIRRSGDATRGEIWHRQLPGFRYLANQIERRSEFLGLGHQFVIAHGGQALHLAHDGAHVAHRFYDIA